MKRNIHHTLIAVGCAVALGGCGDKTTVEMKAALANSKPQAGDKLSVTISIVEHNNAPVSGYRGTVHFESDEDGAQLPADYTFTASDSAGHAFDVPVTRAGKHTLHAIDKAAPSLQTSIVYQVVAGAASKLSLVSGENQGGIIGQALTQPFVVRASDDFDNPVAGVDVAWKASEGGGSVTAGTATTDANGQASATGTLGLMLTMNVYTATATSQTVSFHALSTITGIKHLTLVSGDGQSGVVAKTLGSPLVVKATDAGGNPVPGVPIAWTVAAGGGTFATTTTATGMDGSATATYTLGMKAGPVMLSATAQGVAGLNMTATGTPDAVAKLVKGAGDGQVATAGTALPLPLSAQAADQYDNPVSGVAVTWAALDGGAIAASGPTTATDGTTSAAATLAPDALVSTFQASAAGVATPVKFTAQRKPFKLAYADPAAGGKLRLVKNAASTDASVVLDLVVGDQPVTGYAAGFNLPVDTTRAVLDPAAGLTPGTALSPGSNPVAAKAVLPTSGPLANVLVSAQSQKATGAGAVAGDTTLPAGTVLYSLTLNRVAAGTPGVAFDGTVAGFKVPSGGVRDKTGTQVVNPVDIVIGKLEIIK